MECLGGVAPILPRDKDSLGGLAEGEEVVCRHRVAAIAERPLVDDMGGVGSVAHLGIDSLAIGARGDNIFVFNAIAPRLEVRKVPSHTLFADCLAVEQRIGEDGIDLHLSASLNHRLPIVPEHSSALGLHSEFLDGNLHNIRYLRALTLGEVADGIFKIIYRVAILIEYGGVDIDTIVGGEEEHIGGVGVDQQELLEQRHKVATGYIFRPCHTPHHHHCDDYRTNTATTKFFHIISLFSNFYIFAARLSAERIDLSFRLTVRWVISRLMAATATTTPTTSHTSTTTG